MWPVVPWIAGQEKEEEEEEEEEKENNSAHLLLSKDAYKFLVKVEASNCMKMMIKHIYKRNN